MRIVLFCCVLLNTCISQSWGKDILLYVYSDQSVKRPYLFELEKEMHNMDVDMISYPIDVRRTVDEHVLRIDSIFRDYREKTDSLGIFMLADEEASFVALDVLSKDTAIIALFAMSGVFCNGDDYFYNEVSIKKNLMMLDSVSFDNKKERHLRMVYKMISYAKQGKTVFFSTHILEIAEKLCDRIAIINKGKIIFIGTLNELKDKFGDKNSLEEIFLKII